MCKLTSLIDNGIVLIGNRHANVYMIDLDDHFVKNDQCLVAMNIKINENSWLWYHRLGHASIDLISKLIKRDLVKGLPKLDFEKNKICNAC